MNFFPNNYIEEDIIAETYECMTPADGLGATFALPRRISALQKEAALCAVQDRCRALLAKTAIEHTAALSLMEQQAEQMLPGNAEVFREIVQAYADGAVNQLRRW